MPIPFAATSLAQISPLDRKIILREDYAGANDSLISIICAQADVNIAYSSRVLVRSAISIPRGTYPVSTCLDRIFHRFRAHYVCSGDKIVIAPEDVVRRTLCGYCRDALTGEVLIGAHVQDTILHRVVATNEYGFFSLPLPSGRVPLRTSFVGYNPQIIDVDLSSDTLINILLQPRLLLGTVDVVGEEEILQEARQTGATELLSDQVRPMPALLGESDILQALLHTPGVESGNEGFGGMSVRGGSQDQNLIYLDDAPIYNPNHMLGFFAVFNSDAISKTRIIKSGIPARYGGRMSSVLDIKTIDGNMNHFLGDANLGLLASSVLLQGPIVKDRASFMFSARRTYFDIFSYQIQKDEDNTYSYLFYDFQGKINWHISDRDRLRLSAFYSFDKLTNLTNQEDIAIDYGGEDTRYITVNDKSHSGWGTLLTSLRWNHIFGPNVFCNVTAWYSFYRFRNRQISRDDSDAHSEITNEYRNGIHDVALRADFNVYPSNTSLGRIRAGLWGNYKCYQPIITVYTASEETDVSSESMLRKVDISRMEAHAYVEDQLQFGKFFATAGLHFSFLDRKARDPYFQLEPRVIVGTNPIKPLMVNVGYSLTTQFVYQLRMATISTPSDLWMPVPDERTPQKTSQISLNIHWQFPKSISLGIEGYYKSMPYLLTYKNLSTYDILTTTEWGSLCADGEGYARGVELFLQRRHGRITGWAGYTLSISRNKFDDINDGQYFAADNDRRQSIQLYLNYDITPSIDVSASWNYGTGAPTTISSQFYTLPGSDGVYSVPSRRNAWRMPNSHQLNIGCNIKYGKERRLSVFSFGIYNVYAHKNPSFIYWKSEKDDSGDYVYKLKQFCFIAFPWPYIKYSIRF